LIGDADAVLPDAIPGEFFQPIAGRYPQYAGRNAACQVPAEVSLWLGEVITPPEHLPRPSDYPQRF
jgi:hypothetical protein